MLKLCYGVGTVLGARDLLVDKRDLVAALMELTKGKQTLQVIIRLQTTRNTTKENVKIFEHILR